MSKKNIGELIFPNDVRYSNSHEWGKIVGNIVLVGISDYAQDQLGDVVFVEYPEIGAKFAQGDVFGTVESVKAVSELYMPIGGEIVKTNEGLAESPGLVNEDPYDKGWIIEVRPDNISDLDNLMDSAAYSDMLKGVET